MDDAIGIIGAGSLGQAFARTVRRADRSVVIANRRGPESLTSVVDALGVGVTAGTTEDASSSSPAMTRKQRARSGNCSMRPASFR
jgi:predicted dinucleotide-binding enzyme